MGELPLPSWSSGDGQAPSPSRERAGERGLIRRDSTFIRGGQGASGLDECNRFPQYSGDTNKVTF